MNKNTLRKILIEVYKEMFSTEPGEQLLYDKGCSVCGVKKTPNAYTGYLYPGLLVIDMKVCPKHYQQANANSLKNIQLTEVFYYKVFNRLYMEVLEEVEQTALDYVELLNGKGKIKK